MNRPILLLSLSLLLSGLSAPVAGAELDVTFKGGEVLRVTEVTYQGELALLTLREGGLFGVGKERILRVEPVADGAPAATGPVPDDPVPPAPASRERGDPGGARHALLGGVPSWAPAEILDLIREAARRHDVDAELLRCLIQVESAYDPRSTSPKGAKGLAQLMPGTAADLDVEDPFDPIQAVDAAARHLKALLERNDGRFVPALAAYNAGQGAVERYSGIPPYGETIRYVEKILTLYAAP